MTGRSVLLVNPWIHDFAAYDLWCKPLGLLKIATWLRQAGIAVSMIDCLDRYHPRLLVRKPPEWLDHQRHLYHCGKFPKKRIPAPPVITHIDRPYYQYGLPEEYFIDELKKIEKPDVCMISSMMTYWYPGTQRTIEVIRSVFPDVIIVVGGIYPTLCTEHAQRVLCADYIHAGPVNTVLPQFLSENLKIDGKMPIFDPLCEPAYDLVYNHKSLSILTSVGCPYKCTYCASGYLQPRYKSLPASEILKRLETYCDTYHTEDIAFFDDALLFHADEHIIPFLEKWIATGRSVRFHTPNGLHGRFMNERLARLMYDAKFVTLRLSLETVSYTRQQDMGGKVNTTEMCRSIKYLYKAGFKADQFAVYLLIGLPDQTYEEILTDIHAVHNMGARIDLASYTPLPHTSLWNEMVAQGIVSPEDPLLHNKAVFFLKGGACGLETMRDLRRYVSRLNASLI